MTVPTRRWRVLVSGVGAVGERHIRNLLALGQDDIAVHRSRALPFRTLDLDFPSFNDLRRALAEWRPEVVLVTGPTALHVPVATAAAEAGCHVFVEKPLSNSMEGIDRLDAALARGGRELMVGYMLRFHPLLQRIRDWLVDGTLGRPLHWRSTWGEYLPDWHPWEDYRSGYAARADLGGGPALTLSHDIDVALWLFGDAVRACALPMPATALTLDGPPGLDLLIEHAGGVLANLHLDFWQRPSQRMYEIAATRGRATLDYHGGTLARYAHPEGDTVTPQGLDVGVPVEVVRVSEDWERNDIFVAEIRYFLDCLARGETPTPGLAEGIASTRLAQTLANGGQWKGATRGALREQA